MHKTQVLLLTVVSTLVISSALARSLPISRKKRQVADIQITEDQAQMALIHHIPGGCQEVACGLFDPHRNGKKKRSNHNTMGDVNNLVALNEYDNDSPSKSYGDDDLSYSRLRLLEQILDDLHNK